MKKSSHLHIVALLAISAIPFLRSLSFPLLDGWDDHIYVSANTDKLVLNISNIFYWFKNPCEGCFLPLTMLSYMLDFSIWELSSFGYHLQNLFWHLCATLALYYILIFSGCDTRLSFFSAIFFAIHPQRAESVVWISERKDVLCAAFYLWSLLFFLRSEEKENSNRKFSYALSLLFAIFALLSKAMAVSLPLVILLFSIRQKEKFEKKDIIKLWPFFIITFIFIPIAIISQDIPQAHLSFTRRIAVATMNVPWYFFKFFLPFNLSPIYPRIIPSFTRITTTLIFYSFAIFAILQIIKKEREHYSAFNLLFIACFLISIAPVSGIIPLGAIDYADRYSYIPSVFVILFFASALNRFFSEKKSLRFISIAFSIYLAILSGITYFYSFSWSSYRAVLESAISHDPPAYMALGALADLEFFTGDRSRISQISTIARSRERGWESDTGVRRLFFKLDVLEMRRFYEAGEFYYAANIAERLKKENLNEFFIEQDEKVSFEDFLEKIITSNKLE